MAQNTSTSHMQKGGGLQKAYGDQDTQAHSLFQVLDKSLYLFICVSFSISIL